MQLSITAILGAVFFIMLAVLGHGVWHHGMVSALNVVVNLFTGAHVVGLYRRPEFLISI